MYLCIVKCILRKYIKNIYTIELTQYEVVY